MPVNKGVLHHFKIFASEPNSHSCLSSVLFNQVHLSIGESVDDSLYDLGQVIYSVDQLDLDFGTDEVDLPDITEYQAMGLTTRMQIMALYRKSLNKKCILSSKQLLKAKYEQFVTTAGLLVDCPPIPSNGERFVFLTLEGEFGMINVVLYSNVYMKYR